MRSFHRSAALVAAALLVVAAAGDASAATGRKFAFADDLQVQYSGKLQVPTSTRVVDVDGQDTSAATVRALHASGKMLVCYISAGSLESYRPDARKFPKAVVGKVLDGWPQERWLDIRQRAVLLPLMKARVAMCKSRGFDAMDFDNVDGYSNDTGFPLRAADQLAYDKALAGLAHAAGMRAVLKNTLSSTPNAVPTRPSSAPTNRYGCSSTTPHWPRPAWWSRPFGYTCSASISRLTHGGRRVRRQGADKRTNLRQHQAVTSVRATQWPGGRWCGEQHCGRSRND